MTIISGIDLVSDHDTPNGIFVTVRYCSKGKMYRPSLCWIDQNGVQLACITSIEFEFALNSEKSLIVDGVDII